jgi:hypothetical protein
MLTTKFVVDLIEVMQNNVVRVRLKTLVLSNNTEIAESFEHRVVPPGDDYSAEDAKVQAICSTVHTPDVVEAYRLAQFDKMPNNTVPVRFTGESKDSMK